MPSVAIIGTRGYPSYYGGFETAIRYLAPFLVGAGWDVTVYGRKDTTSDADPTRDKRVRSIATRGIETKALSTLSYGLTASLHTLKEKPDVALIMNVANGYFLPLLKARGIPTLVNVDGIEWERDKWGRAARTVFHTGAVATAKFADQLVFDANAIGSYWGEHFQKDGVVIPYGGQFRDTLLPIERGLQHRRYALVVARFVPENTISEFFDAVELLHNRVPVVIVGSSGYGGVFDRRARELSTKYSSVKWLGHIADDERLHALWQHAGVYFHGHSVGGTNPALVQAMALGAPTIARDTVFNREVLGEEGIFVTTDPADIARKIEQAINSSHVLERYSNDLKKRAQDRYSWHGICTTYSNTLSDLILPKSNRTPSSKGRTK